MKNNTTKPIIIAMNDFKQDIVTVINESQMPIAIVNMLLKDIIIQCDQLEKQELESAIKEYKATENNNNDNDTK